MPQTECRLTWYSSGGHLQQLFTGFAVLESRGLVRVSQRFSTQPLSEPHAPPHLRDVGGAHLGVLVNRDIDVHYDCHDAVEVNRQRLEQCDFYFKRSYSQDYVDGLGRHRHKVFPLGLYYRVLPDTIRLASIQRALIAGAGIRGKATLLLDALDAKNWLKYNARLCDLEALPDYDAPPKVLFLAAAHDPRGAPERTREKIDEMLAINETRARCIATLRRELGPRFLGGFIRSACSVSTYPELVVDESDVTRKRNYIRLLKSFPICVATTGLHGSIGGKFAEYIALAKAVVSERLNFQVPGDLRPGRNYLEFTSPLQCAELAMRLIENRDERSRLMHNNALYYQAYLRPDALVLNTLLQVLSAAPRSRRSPAYQIGQAFA
jgi:hypothetical protein